VTQPANAEAIATWSRMPEETLGAFDPEGDAGRRVLLDPHIFRLLGDVTGRMALDAGCGQGYLARLLAGRGARVTGVEPAEAPYRYATARERDRRQGIYYLQADLSEAGGLDGQFDAVVANVVFESIPDWAPALETCVRALRLGGLLVFSLEHPCFEDAAVSRLCAGTRDLQEYERPGPHGTDFHRPLSSYLNEVIRLGCMLTEVTEPAVPAGQESLTGPAAVHVPNFVIVAARRP